MPHCTFIWDLDGTLVDSYPAIVPIAREVCDGLGLHYSEEYIHRFVIRSSVGALLRQSAAELGADPAPILERFERLNDTRIGAIRAMPHARETLSALNAKGHQSFLYTHRGASCRRILEQAGLSPWFREVVTALDGFPRKPSPEAIVYLIEKYGLERARCYYVGDRPIDIEAAENAGIGSVLYLSPDSPGEATGRETCVVRSLAELTALF